MQTTTIYVTHDQIEAMTLADRIVILKDGYIQQVGSPLEVFEKPVNKFVASFIGNPPINIQPGQIKKDGATTSLSIGELTFPLQRDGTLQDGQKVLAGIRPDIISNDHTMSTLPDEWKIKAKIVVAEILGGQSLVEFTTGGTTFIAELEGRLIIKPGEIMELGFDLNRLLLFDPESELTIYS